MPISDRNFGEKDSVTSCAPTNSPTPIQTLGQPLIFGFETIRTIGTCIQLVTTKSTNFFRRSEKVGQLRSYGQGYSNNDPKLRKQWNSQVYLSSSVELKRFNYFLTISPSPHPATTRITLVRVSPIHFALVCVSRLQSMLATLLNHNPMTFLHTNVFMCL